MTTFFYNLLVFFTWLIPGHYVWVAIVVITVLLRLAFFKPTVSMLKMQHKQKGLQGKLKEIQRIHKDDKKAQQQAVMDLYRQEGVNPLGSCLPMIIQIVVLIGFYGVFTKIGLGKIKPEYLYSFTPRPDFINSHFLGIDLTLKISELVKAGGVKGYLALLFPLLTGGSQLIQSLQAKASQLKPDEEEDQSAAFSRALTNQMTFLFPIMAAYISYTLTSALSVYWITQTILMIIQQKIIINRLKIAEVVAEEVAEATGAKKISSFKKGDVLVSVKEKEE